MNPHLYLNNLSIVFVIGIPRTMHSENMETQQHGGGLQYVVNSHGDESLIAHFYNLYGRKEYTPKFVQSLYAYGSTFHSLREQGRIIAGMWLHSDYLFLKDPSFFTLQNKRMDAVQFSSDAVYSGHNLVIPECRGRHMLSLLFHNVLNYYSDKKSYYIFMTSADSQVMMNFGAKHGARIVAIESISRVLSVFWKKRVYYRERSRDYWNSIPREMTSLTD